MLSTRVASFPIPASHRQNSSLSPPTLVTFYCQASSQPDGCKAGSRGVRWVLKLQTGTFPECAANLAGARGQLSGAPGGEERTLNPF